MTRLKKPFAVVERGAVRVDGMVVTDEGSDVSLDAVAYGLNSRVEAIVREARAEVVDLYGKDLRKFARLIREGSV